MVLLWVCTALAGTSVLWGEQGEAFDPLGRLPDYSWAGYHGNEAELPSPDVVADVVDFGAVADDGIDDTEAFQAAIAAAQDAGGGAVAIGPGTWLLSDVLTISQSGVVLRGSGSDSTELQIDVSLSDAQGEREQWSWEGGFLWFTGAGNGSVVTEVIEAAERGDNTVTVADASGITAGELVVLRRTDDDDGTFGWHLHNDQREAGDCTYQDPMVLDWPVEVTAVDGNTLTLLQPLRLDVSLDWTPQVLDTRTWIRDVGVEGMTLTFPDNEYAGHLNEPGYNGVFFDEGVVDAWVVDLAVHNSDNGVLTGSHAKWILVDGLSLTGRDGHHGFNIAFTHDMRATDFSIEADFVHAITVDHRTSGSVFHRGSSSLPMELDHHKDAPHENLFTHLDASVNFLSGGSECAGPASGARETFWLSESFAPPPWDDIQANSIGAVNADEELTVDEAHNEPIDALWPRDLFVAQLAWRRGEALEDTAVEVDTSSVDTGPGDAASSCGGCAGTQRGAPVGILLSLLALWRRRR